MPAGDSARGRRCVAGLIATLFAATAIIAADPWYAPRYVLPILGMMLGNALSGTSLVLDSMTQGAMRERAAIEASLALGATRFEAMRGVLRRALTTGLMPILTAMAATGIVSLPGMMTGQILAGIEPIAAAKYQVMIMFLIVGRDRDGRRPGRDRRRAAADRPAPPSAARPPQVANDAAESQCRSRRSASTLLLRAGARAGSGPRRAGLPRQRRAARGSAATGARA